MAVRTLLMLGVSVGFLAGCSPGDREVVDQDVQGLRQQVHEVTEGARQAGADRQLAGRVRSRLETQRGLDASQIQVEAVSGRVLLQGDVATPEEAETAERVAVETEGVEAVENQLMMRVPARRLPAEAPPPGRQPERRDNFQPSVPAPFPGPPARDGLHGPPAPAPNQEAGDPATGLG
jgi:hypothetical protein